MGGPEFEGNGLDCLVGQQGEGFRIDFQNFATTNRFGGDKLRGNLLVFGGIGAERERVLVVEFGHGGEWVRGFVLRRLRCSP